MDLLRAHRARASRRVERHHVKERGECVQGEECLLGEREVRGVGFQHPHRDLYGAAVRMFDGRGGRWLTRPSDDFETTISERMKRVVDRHG